MFKFILHLLGIKKKKKTKVPTVRSHYYERMWPPFRTKQKKPPFPSTFVCEDYVYEQWNRDLIDNYGWTKKEIKQGWRWVEL
jgi:hypothetical protein